MAQSSSIVKLVADLVDKKVVSVRTLVYAVLLVIIVLLLSAVAVLYTIHPIAALYILAIFSLSIAYWFFNYGYGVFGWNILNTKRSARLELCGKSSANTVSVVCISDTHGQHERLRIPYADILIHAGDFTQSGTCAEVLEFMYWIDSLPHKHKVIVAGNHDLAMDSEFYMEHGHSRHGDGIDKFKESKVAQDRVRSSREKKNVLYLENESVTVEGIKIYGSPITAPIPGRVMAFNCARDSSEEKYWQHIPSDTAILVTHGPPHGTLDRTVTALHVGDEALGRHVRDRVKPIFHVFGHIHESFGVEKKGPTTFVNAATNTLLGEARHEAIVLNISGKKRL